MIVGVATQGTAAERRVALVPLSVRELSRADLEVVVERGAGSGAGYPDADYEGRGARLLTDAAEVASNADILVCVGPDGLRVDALRRGHIVIGLLDPLGSAATMQQLAASGVTSFALELLPRITRAQSMDALSSMATVAGYKAVLLGAGELGKMFPMMITAAGTLAPAKVLVIGAGVAGLGAIATARRLGALVTGYDIRPDVREQVESLGAVFLELELDTGDAEDEGGYAQQMDEDFYRRQREMMAEAVADNDVVITTAAVPGKRAPVLITEDMVRGMAGGSVIVDLAAETGGNCELTRAGETVEAHGVTIMGPVGVPATVAHHASQMYAKNVTTFVINLVKDGELALNLDDEIIKDTMVTHDGEVTNERVREALGAGAAVSPTQAGDAGAAPSPARAADAGGAEPATEGNSDRWKSS
ncbi:MAG: Re/Si-specific NAD(P)(+) transhydrogenase subunit alpha [Acidobacteria bacterium]|nr:Re/Si-specific NAD(P)(+) transhydrogenase subunit alpha [Acidobacteriota bacterium]